MEVHSLNLDWLIEAYTRETKNKEKNIPYSFDGLYYLSSDGEIIEAAAETLNALNRTKRDIYDALGLIREYSEKSHLLERASYLASATCKTLETLTQTKRHVPSAVALIRAYHINSSGEEWARTLAEATCQTLATLDMTNSLLHDGIALIEAYSKNSNSGKSAFGLNQVTCQTLEYLSQNGLDLGLFLERIRAVRNDLTVERTNEHNHRKQEIRGQYSGPQRWIKLLKEKWDFNENKPFHLSVQDLYDKLVGRN